MKKISFLILFLFTAPIFSQIEETNIQIKNLDMNQKQILSEAEKNLTYKLISEILGKEDLTDIETSIEKKILPQSKKFILLTQIINKKSKDKKNEEEKEYNILIRFSRNTLQNILIQENLYYMDESSNRIITLIEFKDKKLGQKFRSWENSKNIQADVFQKIDLFYQNIQSFFMNYGFYTMNPILSRQHARLPKPLMYGSLNINTAKKLASFFSAHLIILGSIELSPLSDAFHQVLWRLHLYHTQRSQALASHQFRIKISIDEYNKKSWSFLNKTENINEWMTAFAAHLKSIYEKGALSSNVFKINIQGRINPREREEIKAALKKHIPQIQNLRIHLISADDVQYNADVKTNARDLFNQIKNLKVLDFKLTPYLESSNHILIKVKK